MCYIVFMTKDDLFFYTEAKKEIEFTYKDRVFSITYGTDEKGYDYILFGRLYEGERYSSFKDLYARAKIDNSYFREMLDVIDIR